MLGALLSHGVPIHHAIHAVVVACRNSVIQNELQSAADWIKKGGRIGASLLKGKHLPPLLGQMITIAEDTNQLEQVLDKVAKSGNKEVERKVALFTRLLEPAMIVFIGAIIGFIVFAMMLPIFQIDFVVQ